MFVCVYSGIRLLATRVLLIKWLLIREVANKGTELIQNLHLGPEDWLLLYTVYIYICNELIEETAKCRKLIFGMWESFSYGSRKF